MLAPGTTRESSANVSAAWRTLTEGSPANRSADGGHGGVDAQDLVEAFPQPAQQEAGAAADVAPNVGTVAPSCRE
jgi:hypothetical protein